MDNRPIGIFDSGVGGLTILTEIKKLLPRESFIYLADQKNNPYGGRTVAKIKSLSSKVVAFLLKKDVKLIVVACNTVSVNAIDYLRQEFDVPIIAVVPVVKTLAKKTKTRKTAVFSTPATARSRYLKDLIKKFASEITVYTIGTSKLEHLVEKGIIDGSEIETAIKRSLLPLLAKKVDSIALGCTHYPFLTEEIKKIVGKKVTIYDSGGAVARRVKQILAQEDMASAKKLHDLYYTTADSQKFRVVSQRLLGYRLDRVYKAEL